MFELIIDDQLSLELPRMQQADELFALVMDNYQRLHEWMPWCDESYSRRSVDDFIERSRLEFTQAGAGLALNIIFDKKIVGGIGIHDISLQDRSGESGYWIGEEYSGRGIVTRSTKALLDHAFNSMRLNRMVIKCVPENSRSRAVPERLGFVSEGIEREAGWLHGRFVDHVVYSMLASEWKEKSWL